MGSWVVVGGQAKPESGTRTLSFSSSSGDPSRLQQNSKRKTLPYLVVPLDFNQLRELLTTIAQTDIAELTLKSADFELKVRKGIPVMPTLDANLTSQSSVLTTAPIPAASSISAPPAPVPEVSVTDRPTAPPVPPPVVDSKWVDVKSPMVGTFYRAPAPDESPYVEVGDRISTGQTVCIIEAMKLMNEIEAELSGQVMEILVENGEPVEYGQALMRINPG